ncbi:hypothetical protein EYF80_048502 [Liparis tanakae]|uniref:Uncharacterized protein n=1 Tax=Liparis tanakae TaxID=230148 RepID=A0A4Z2FJG3_9TELE|nr:hypothetical protein EYF80_048502 [Liparis tanakae]
MQDVHQHRELGLDQRPQPILQRRHDVLQETETHKQSRDSLEEVRLDSRLKVFLADSLQLRMLFCTTLLDLTNKLFT